MFVGDGGDDADIRQGKDESADIVVETTPMNPNRDSEGDGDDGVDDGFHKHLGFTTI